MDIYRTFTRQTEQVVAYLSVARQHEHHTRVQVPKLKHAPVHLARQLEEYLNDPDFETNRRQYMAEQSAKGRGGAGSTSSKPLSKANDTDFPAPAANNPFPRSNESKSAEIKQEPKPQVNKGPDPDLIDFFDSIEQNQTPMPTQVNNQQTGNPMNNGFQPQPTGMQFQPNNGFVQSQPTGFASNSPYQQQPQQQPHQAQQTGDFYQNSQFMAPQPTGAGFGGFTSQQQGFQPGNLGAIPQDSMASFQNQGQSLQPMQTGQPGFLQPAQTGQQTTNPFRQSMLMTQQTGMQSPPASTVSSPTTNPLTRQSTNPFARSPQSQSPYNSGTNSPFQSQSQQQPPAPLQPTPTGTNPFTRKTSPQLPDQQRPQTAGGALAPQPTGSTNPFRQSAFVNHNTGMGWQHNQQAIGGGLDQLPTQPVFPRPAQQSPWQQ